MKAVNPPNPKRRNEATTSAPSSSLTSTSTPTTVELRGVPIHFPFRPYPCQETYMEKVLDALHRSENALLESPTGTGKTLCLLCATLAWQREQARLLPQNINLTAGTEPSATDDKLTNTAKSGRVPTILYASRTHSQLSQVVRELRNTRYRPKHAVLGSREQMCVHPKVKTAQATASDINHDCNKLAKDRKCRFRNQLEGFVPPNAELGATTQPVLDMEDLLQMGTSHRVCPFYYTRSLVADAELIFIPYNYIFDKDARDSTLADVPWDNAIVIFDEAHNLESFASESASFDWTSTLLAGCIAELTKAMQYIQNMPELADRCSLENLARLKALFLNLEEYINRIPSHTNVYSGEYMMEILTLGASINHANHVIFLREVAKVIDLLLDMRSGATKGSPLLETFVSGIKHVFGETTEARCWAKAQSYRVHITPPSPTNGRILSYWCFAPALAMQELSNLNVRSILVTSGTLSPLPSYTLELGLPFPHTVENPHIIGDDQIHVRVIGHGVSGKLLNSSYNRREDGEYISELGNTLVSLARVVPAGMLVFFPSYGVMETCIERWGGPTGSRSKYSNNGKNSNSARDKFFQARRRANGSSSTPYAFPHAPNFYAATETSPSTPWKRLLTQKAIIVEPKTTTDLPDAIAEFHKFLRLPKSKGCILMGVCRGKISEGIDFAHDMCRAVVITGLPFAPYLDPKVKLKREYLDGVRAGQCVKASGEGGFGNDSGNTDSATVAARSSMTLSGAEWYTQQAHRAVNQAIGRVIRNKSDYGAVLLLDSRFGESRNQQGLSKWIRPHVQKDEGFGVAVGSLVRFYKEAQHKFNEQEERTSRTPSTSAGILLHYENDSQDVEVGSPLGGLNATMTKIAVIQTSVSETPRPSDASAKEMAMRHSPLEISADRGYIPPERVIARMDLKELEAKKDGGTMHLLPTEGAHPKTDLRATGLEAVYQSGNSTMNRMKTTRGISEGTSAWSHLDVTKENSVAIRVNKVGNEQKDVRVSERSKQGKAGKKSDAVLFFEKARSTVTSEDFASIRKEIVAMKSHGDKKDVRSYMRSAQNLTSVLIRYEGFDEMADTTEPGMLDLLLPLLPDTYRGDVRRMGVKLKFRRSEFNCSCEASLSSEGNQTVGQMTLALLLQLHCKPSDSIALTSNSSYLQDVEPIIKTIHQHDIQAGNNKEAPSLIVLFLRLLPPRLRNATQALVNELDASRKVELIKNSERAKVGEVSVDTTLFSKPVTASMPQPASWDLSKSEQTPDVLEDQKSMEAALVHAEELNRAKRDRIERLTTQAYKVPVHNPYASSSGRTTGVQAVAKTTQADLRVSRESAKRARRTERTSQTSKVVSSTFLQTDDLSQSNSDPVAQCLQQVQSDAFVNSRARVRPLTSGLRSNAPDGLTCTVCERPSAKPFMADCGHTACLECWSKWLDRSQSCPVCRAHTTKGSLARVIFEKQPGAGPPSLSQLYPPVAANDAESSDEDELVLVHK